MPHVIQTTPQEIERLLNKIHVLTWLHVHLPLPTPDGILIVGSWFPTMY